MDRPLAPPLLLRTIGEPKKLSKKDAYPHLQAFLEQLPPSTSRTQLERLTDAIGVEAGLVELSEAKKREAARLEEKRLARAEKRRLKAEEKAREEAERMEGIEAELEDEGYAGEENGAAGFEDEEQMDDRGEVEYGDNEPGDDDDQDEPDQQREAVDHMEQ
jgi:hypothetical protein